jgi:hypothetical protein
MSMTIREITCCGRGAVLGGSTLPMDILLQKTLICM